MAIPQMAKTTHFVLPEQKLNQAMAYWQDIYQYTKTKYKEYKTLKGAKASNFLTDTVKVIQERLKLAQTTSHVVHVPKAIKEQEADVLRQSLSDLYDANNFNDVFTIIERVRVGFSIDRKSVV